MAINMKEKIDIKHLKKPIQVIGIIMIGMITTNAAFLTFARFISEPLWLHTLLIFFSLLTVFVFLYCIFKLITKYRVEMQDDKYYSEYLKYNKVTDKYEYQDNPFEKMNLKINRILEYQIKNQKSNLDIENKEEVSFIVAEISEDKKKIIAEIFNIENYYGRSELFSKREPLNETMIKKVHLEINDLIPDYLEIMDKLYNNGFNIHSTFGSDSDQKEIPKQLTLTFGMDVPIEYTQNLIRILKEYGLDSIDFVDFRQEVYDEFLGCVFIGSYSYDDIEVEIVKLSEELFSRILDPTISANDFYANLLAKVQNPVYEW